MIARLVLTLLIAVGVLVGIRAAHADVLAPVPAVTLYPGDRIRDASLVDATIAGGGDAVLDRAKLVGKVARRTLLAGRPIPESALEEPRLVAVGATVRLLFDEPGLVIATTGQALQPGMRGELVRVRNMESGVVISGVVQPDGSIKVGE